MKATLLLAVSALATPAAIAQLSFQPLGIAPGRPSSRAQGVSADGNTVVGDDPSIIFPTPRGWYWRPASGMTLLPAEANRARSVSASGDIIAGLSGNDNGGSLFRYTISTATLLVPPPLGGFGLEGIKGSDDGTVIVGKVWAIHSNIPYMWKEGVGYSGFPYAPNTDMGIAYSTSADGAVVVGVMANSASGVSTAFRWTSAGTVALNGLAGAYDVSPDGSIVVGYLGSSDGIRPGRWSAAQGVQNLGAPAGSTDARALALTPDGSVVVGYYRTDNADHALIWDQAHGARDLQLVLEQQGSSGEILQWTLQRATDVSADGNTIVGYGLDPQGRTQAFLARIGVPCYPNCDASSTPPVLNILDFNCFLNRFTAGDTYGNCDGSTEPPVLNVLDFNCFLNMFAQGC